jgi:DNA-binding CsgD family transcriptional regulator
MSGEYVEPASIDAGSPAPDLQPEKTAGYRLLVRRFGEGRVGDAVLAKWLSDPDGSDAFERLFVSIVSTDEFPPGGGIEPRTLPPSELRALRLLANGLREKEIAASLGRSPYTIKRQIGSAMDRLQAPNALAAVATALRTGLLRPEDIADDDRAAA